MKFGAIILLLPAFLWAQQEPEPPSIHQIESELHQNDPPVVYDTPATTAPFKARVRGAAAVSRKVLGWHPYWASASAFQYYNYTALTHIAYFSYETDTATGGYKTIRGWD